MPGSLPRPRSRSPATGRPSRRPPGSQPDDLGQLKTAAANAAVRASRSVRSMTARAVQAADARQICAGQNGRDWPSSAAIARFCVEMSRQSPQSARSCIHQIDRQIIRSYRLITRSPHHQIIRFAIQVKLIIDDGRISSAVRQAPRAQARVAESARARFGELPPAARASCATSS